jgi:hypothetical protein
MKDPDSPTGGVGHRKSIPYFVRHKDNYRRNPIAQSLWGAAVGRHIVSSLLAWTAQRIVDDPGAGPDRLNVDLPYPAALEPIVNSKCAAGLVRSQLRRKVQT